ncbi:MAG TPA: TlpA disulfide reductase family protein [Nitrospira sp.]|nr:TlpA disulfide reductase family protein [Nitrospira sp.]
MNRLITMSLALCLTFSTSTELRAAAVGAPVPAFELVTITGESYSKESLKGRPVLLVFWAPWCQVCQRDLPLLSEFYRHGRPEQLDVVSIGFADTRTNVERFVKERSGTFVYPTAYDEDRWVAQEFKVNATPTYVLVDAQGTIVLVHRGGGVLQNPQFREFISTVKG